MLRFASALETKTRILFYFKTYKIIVLFCSMWTFSTLYAYGAICSLFGLLIFSVNVHKFSSARIYQGYKVVLQINK